jgi:hypothetical protein
MKKIKINPAPPPKHPSNIKSNNYINKEVNNKNGEKKIKMHN